MTYASCIGSITLSLLSIVFGLLCLWSLIGVHPTRLKVHTRLATCVGHTLMLLQFRQYLVGKNALLFYYLHATPSMFGASSAGAFFVAVGAWTWLDMGIEMTGWAGRVFAILISVALVGNACLCFVVGASTSWKVHLYEDPPK